MKERLPVIDLLRCLIIYWVLLFHLNGHFILTFGKNTINQLIGNGAVAMSIFFILSGFLLKYKYVSLFCSDWKSCVKFYKKCFFKLYPLYITTLIIIILMRYLLGIPAFPKWYILIMNLIPMHTFFPTTFNIFANGGLWFISDIFLLYLCFPFFNYIISKLKINKIILISILSCVVLYFSIIDAYFPSPGQYFLYTNPFIRMIEFFCGITTCYIFLKNINTSQKNEIETLNSLREGERERERESTAIILKIVYPVIFLSVLIIQCIIIGKTSNNIFLNHTQYGGHYIYFDFFVIPMACICIYSGAKCKKDFLYILSSKKIFSYFAKIGYAFYLVQTPMLGFFIHYKEFIIQFSNLQKIMYATILNCILAACLYTMSNIRILNCEDTHDKK